MTTRRLPLLPHPVTVTVSTWTGCGPVGLPVDVALRHEAGHIEYARAHDSDVLTVELITTRPGWARGIVYARLNPFNPFTRTAFLYAGPESIGTYDGAEEDLRMIDQIIATLPRRNRACVRRRALSSARRTVRRGSTNIDIIASGLHDVLLDVGST